MDYAVGEWVLNLSKATILFTMCIASVGCASGTNSVVRNGDDGESNRLQAQAAMSLDELIQQKWPKYFGQPIPEPRSTPYDFDKTLQLRTQFLLGFHEGVEETIQSPYCMGVICNFRRDTPESHARQDGYSDGRRQVQQRFRNLQSEIEQELNSVISTK